MITHLLINLLILINISFAGAPVETLNLFMGYTNKPPYDENAPAEVLSTFQQAVLGLLIDYDENLKLKPVQLESWSWDYKNSKYILTLKDNIYFHNGRKATAQDLEYSLVRGFFSKNKSFYQIYLGNIVGVDKISSGANFKSGAIEGVKIESELSVSVKITNYNPTWIYVLTRPYFSLVPREELENNNLTWKDIPIGAGPYRVKNKYKDGIVVIEKINPAASGPSIVFMHTNYDQKILYDLSLKELPERNRYESTQSKYPLIIWGIFFNNVNPLGSDINFKHAIKYSLNRSEISNNDPLAKPAYEPLTSLIWGRNNTKYDPDIKKSLAYLEKVKALENQKKFKVPVFSGTKITESRLMKLQIISDQLKKIGLDVEFYPTSEKFISYETAKSSPFIISGRVANMLDPLLMFASYRKNSPYEFESPKDGTQFEKLYVDALNAKDDTSRLKTIQNLSKYVGDESIMIPILEIKSEFLYLKKKIKSIGNQFKAQTLDLQKVEIND